MLDTIWVAENHHRYRVAQMQQDYRSLLWAEHRSRSSRDSALKSVTFNDRTVSSVQADIHSPSGSTFSGLGTNARLKEKRHSPSSGKASDPQLQQHMSSPRVSDVGSDRESLDLSRLFGSLATLDPCRVSTPQKLGTLPYVPRLDKPDQAVPTTEASDMVEELSLSPIRAASPFPVPAPRPSIPSASRRRHHSYAQGRLLDVESVSEEEYHSLPASLPATSVDTSSLAQRAGPSRRCLLYTSPSPRDRQKSRMPSSA